MKILVINAGSSSLKYQLFEMLDKVVIAKGLVERIGIADGKLTHRYGENGKFELDVDMKNHTVAMEHVLEALMSPEHGVIHSIDEISAVGHRVLHGGEKLTKSIIIDDYVEQVIEEYFPLGPLHNPANLMGIRACKAIMPDTPMVAVFDTAFHQTMPPKAYLYGIPRKYYENLGIRRYGFHGTSHRYIAGEIVKKPGLTQGSRVIIAHLGNGSSLSACVDGKCQDTSMGLTPLEGVLMGTRSGSLDPAVVQFISERENMTATQVVNMLNKESGLLALSQRSSDMRDVYTGAEEGDKNCQETLDVWAYGVKKYVGAYAAAMGGLDALVFTAGIGENDYRSRASVCEGLEFMGIKIDARKNEALRGVEGMISAEDSKVQVWVMPTNEELAIARDTLSLVTAEAQ
ncbi:MAG: acetate/propionate family kinase [Candidatus Excrementavichristensenella sp.]|jgi:acetate kinase